MKNKTFKFEELHSLPNVYQKLKYGDTELWHQGLSYHMAGKWSEEHFGNNWPLVLELACGRGEYSRAIAKDYEKNCIGIDLKGNRIWHGARMALRDGIKNVAFLRSRVESLEELFAPDEVSEIWITFADPQRKKPRKRLCSELFLGRYTKILKVGGLLHLKTDSELLFDSSLASALACSEDWELLFADRDIYAGHPMHTPELEYKTYYEGRQIDPSGTIKYMRLRRKAPAHAAQE